MSSKYDVSKIRDIERSYDISKEDFYTYTVEKAAISFLENKSDEVKELLSGYGDFSQGNEALSSYYSEKLLDLVTGENHAVFIKEHANNEFEYDLFNEGSLVPVAARAFANDIFDRAAQIYESMSEEFGNLIESMDDVLSGLKKGTLQYNANDSLHLAVLSGIENQNGYEGDLKSVLRQFKDDEVDYSAGSDDIELAQKFAVELAFNSTMDDVNRHLFPAVSMPGSMEEAAMLTHFLLNEDAFAGWSRGGLGLGDHYIDSRSDPEIEVRIFKQYTDNLAKHVLGQYIPPIEHIGLHDEAKALSTLGLKEPEIDAFVAKHLVPQAEDLPYKATTSIVNDVMGKISSGAVKASDYVELAKNRDLHHVFAKEVQKYFSVMHPEVARQIHIELKQDMRTMAATMVGLMDGSPSAQKRFAEWQQELDEKIPAPTKALGAFRKSVYPEQEQKLDGPGIR